MALLACGTSEGDEAAQRYDMLRANQATTEELCAEARKVSAAYLADLDEGNFATWKATEREQCSATRATARKHAGARQPLATPERRLIVSPAPGQEVKEQTPTKDWLVGAWAPEAGMCDSDGGIVFKRDGTFHAPGVSGTWRVEGASLVTLTTQRGEGLTAVQPPERSIERFTLVRPDAYRTVTRNGSKFRNVRCPG